MCRFLFVMEPNTQKSGKLFKDTLYIRALGSNFYFAVFTLLVRFLQATYNVDSSIS